MPCSPSRAPAIRAATVIPIFSRYPPFLVIPAKAGIQIRYHANQMDSRLRGNDGN